MPRRCLANNGASERQYLDLVKAIMDYGVDRGDRTGTGTRALHGETMRYDLFPNVLPLLTTKRVPFRLVESELRWFLNGSTNIRPLLLENNSIWTDWPYKAYQKQTGDTISMAEFEERIRRDEAFAAQWGELGPVYGKQWRQWQGPDGKIYDQLSDLIARIRRDPESRRLLFHGWNVAEVDQMALPPCHLLYQFFVANGRLSLTLYQRSCDVALGVPFNIASAALLVHLVAQQCDLQAGELFWVGHDVHLYHNHLEPIQVQLERTPRPFPTLELRRRPDSLFEYQADDFVVHGYQPDKSIKMDVAV